MKKHPSTPQRPAYWPFSHGDAQISGTGNPSVQVCEDETSIKGYGDPNAPNRSHLDSRNKPRNALQYTPMFAQGANITNALDSSCNYKVGSEHIQHSGSQNAQISGMNAIVNSSMAKQYRPFMMYSNSEVVASARKPQLPIEEIKNAIDNSREKVKLGDGKLDMQWADPIETLISQSIDTTVGSSQPLDLKSDKVEQLVNMFPSVDVNTIQDILLALEGDMQKAIQVLLEMSDSPQVSFSGSSSQECFINDCELGLADLRIYLPNHKELELKMALEAMNGNVKEALDLLLSVQEEEALRRRQRVEEDFKTAREFAQREADGAAFQAAFDMGEGRSGAPPGPGAQTGGSGPASGYARLMQGSATLDLLDDQISALRGESTSSSLLQPSMSYSSSLSADSVNLRKVSTLRRYVDKGVDDEVLASVLATQGGDIEKARLALEQLGLVTKEVSVPGMSEPSLRPPPLLPSPGVFEIKDKHLWNQAEYERHRALPFELSQKRQEVFQRASELEAIGEKDAAQKLRKQGMALAVAAREAHQAAAAEIFERLNAPLVNTWEVELHALHVPEAIQKIEFFIDKLKELPSRKIISFITGRGKHSKADGPKLRNAVHEYLMENGIEFNEKIGCFDVILDGPTSLKVKAVDGGGGPIY